MDRATRGIVIGVGSAIALGVAGPAFGQVSLQPVVDDAAVRSALGSNGEAAIVGGKDSRGFYLESGETRIYVGGNFQFRYLVTSRDTPVDQDELATGFGNRRLRLAAQGNLSKDLSFIVQGDANSGDAFKLVDAYATFKLDDGITVSVGQTKPWFTKEEAVSHTRLQGVERSTVNTIFTANFAQGVQAQWTGESVRAGAMFSDGINTFNTNYISASEADYATTARAEWKWAGDWKQFDEFTSWRGKSYAGYLGGAVHFQDGGETVGTADTSVFQYTLDAASKGDGWNIFAAFMGRNTEPAGGNSFDDFGVVLSGGAFVMPQAELFARWSAVLPDDSRANGADFHEITFGANYFLIPESHAAKLTTDVTWALDAQADASALVTPKAVDGLLASTEDNQVYFRLQFQLVF